jgi:hypothetical protein
MDDCESSNGNASRAARRFTTLEGWREVQNGLYLTAGSTMAAIIPNPTYDSEWPVRDGNRTHTRLSRLQVKAIGGFDPNRPGQTGLWPHGPSYWTARRDGGTVQEDQLDASSSEASHELSSEGIDAPFHVFSNRMKWFVIIIIGVAGLFSGLSSNIYLPSLSAIAKVRGGTLVPLVRSRSGLQNVRISTLVSAMCH